MNQLPKPEGAGAGKAQPEQHRALRSTFSKREMETFRQLCDPFEKCHKWLFSGPYCLMFSLLIAIITTFPLQCKVNAIK